jgi:hypothetical protein
MRSPLPPIVKELEREPRPYDSHPRPVDRIRWVQELRSSHPSSPTDATEVWDLFEEREAVERRVTHELRT